MRPGQDDILVLVGICERLQQEARIEAALDAPTRPALRQWLNAQDQLREVLQAQAKAVTPPPRQPSDMP